MTENEIDKLLKDAVEAYRNMPNSISVPSAIKAIAGKDILPLLGSDDDKQLVELICLAAQLCIDNSSKEYIVTNRVNELGNALEKPVLDCCNAVGLRAVWPLRADGSGGRSGYPDILIYDSSERPTYLEVKVVGSGKDKSSFRSFYLSPSENPKVVHDARHLLIAFGHKKERPTPDGREQYSLTGYKLVDLYRVMGGVKFEYQSSNAKLYGSDAVVATG